LLQPCDQPPVIVPVRPQTIPVTVGGTTIIINIIIIEAKDSEDAMAKKAKFEISIISRECCWAYESTTDVVLNGKPIELTSFFQTPGLQARFKEAKDIIAIGAASEQGSTEREYKRSAERANQLVHWLRQAATPESVNLWTLSLGKHDNAGHLDKEESANQRSIVIVSVIDKDEDVNLKAALRNALESCEALPFPITKYPKFDLVQVGGKTKSAF
jgi:hypothetical protein